MTHNPHAIESLSISKLHPHAGNARQHSKKQIDQIAKSIERFGFTNPVFISDDGEIIAGHGRVLAASKLGMDSVPTLRLSHLSKDESRAYVLADNQLALNAGWDRELPAIELQGRIDIDFDLDLMGFSQAEIDFTLDFAQNASTIPSDESADFVPEVATTAVTRRGDVWLLGSHRLLCGDAQESADVERIMAGRTAELIFTDPPYNVRIDGHVMGLGKVRHREFAFASGEMSQVEFTAFLSSTLGNAARHASDGAIAYVCMDWRHMGELLDAGRRCFRN